MVVAMVPLGIMATESACAAAGGMPVYWLTAWRMEARWGSALGAVGGVVGWGASPQATIQSIHTASPRLSTHQT